MQITTFNPMILTSIENSERANDKMFILWEPPGSFLHACSKAQKCS